MKVYIEKDDRSVQVNEKNISGLELLEFLKINPASVILVKNDEVVLDDELFSEDDDVKILSVVSGGWNEVLKMWYEGSIFRARTVSL